ncbi:MAG: hypothetical protein SH817_06755 [Leptospira sp.]|nr:hypothetical protein [Leptospira sp.]
MVTIGSNLQSIVNLPKEIFQANTNLSEKLMKMAVEEKVGEISSPQRLLDVYC